MKTDAGRRQAPPLSREVRAVIVKALGAGLASQSITQDEWTAAWTWVDETWMRQLSAAASRQSPS